MANFTDENDTIIEDTDIDTAEMEISDDLSEALSYYDTATDSTNLTATAAKLYSSEGFESFCASVVENLESDPTFLISYLQSTITRTEVDYTLGELIPNAPIQMQRGLSGSVLSKILADPKTGLAVNPSLMFAPQVVRLRDGSLRLIGGNHRLAVVYMMLVKGGASLDTILSTQIKCDQFSVDMDALRDSMTVYDEQGNAVLPKKADLYKEADAIAFRLWVGSNQSRSMPAGEIKDAEVYSLNVDRNDADAIREAAFGDVKLIGTPDALRMLTRLEAMNILPELLDDEGRPVHAPDAVPVTLTIGGVESVLKNTTFENIVKSAITQLGKYAEEHMREDARTGSTKPYDHKVWSKDMKEQRTIGSVANYLATELEGAINRTLQSIPSDDAYAGNVARNASKIGAVLAETVHANYEPFYVYEAPTKKKAAKSAVRPMTRRTLAV